MDIILQVLVENHDSTKYFLFKEKKPLTSKQNFQQNVVEE